MVKIMSVTVGSLAEKAGIAAGDVLLSIDSHPIRDILDYRFFLTEKKITLQIRRGKDVLDFPLSKGRYDDIGLEFETYLMDQKTRCANRCIFCFIDQNPCGMRETVYFKDDDTRLSFIQGNYVTLTNVSDKELERIVKMRLSPVNVSVHTTNPALRVKMLGNPRADRILDQLKTLADGRIELNCQIVSCCGINDGAELIRTVRDLERFYPAVQSIAVVPAGLTRHRQGLYPIAPYDREKARELIRIVETLGNEYREKYGVRLVYASDEFYLTAEEEIPPEEAYDGYPQLDNGVGLLRSTREDVLWELARRVESGAWEKLPKKKVAATLVTGTAAHGLMEELCRKIEEALPQLRFEVVAVKNRFFGESVTVAGLLCGQDILSTLQSTTPERVIIPAVSLRYERDKFLDDMDIEELRRSLGCPVYALETGTPLLDLCETLLTEE